MLPVRSDRVCELLPFLDKNFVRNFDRLFGWFFGLDGLWSRFRLGLCRFSRIFLIRSGLFASLALLDGVELFGNLRLLALGLATGVVAKVVNILGSLAGSGVVGLIVFICVFLFGTVFNLAINALGAYVHSCRLQYVEFFGKFYTGGGRTFEPLAEDTKFVKIVNKEDK